MVGVGTFLFKKLTTLYVLALFPFEMDPSVFIFYLFLTFVSYNLFYYSDSEGSSYNNPIEILEFS
jgi:hypothetical protein